MNDPVYLSVRVLSADVGCDACGASIDDVPVEFATAWAEGHREPVFAALVTNLGRWERR